MSQSLWGNLETLMKKNTPKSILLEQADHLQRETNGMLVVTIDSQGDIKGDIVHKMNISVPALDDYKYNLLSISHKISLYPVTIHHPVQLVEVNDEQMFEIELGKIFKSKPVRNALQALLLQARDMHQGEEQTDKSGLKNKHARALA